jgi:tetratricopeptide (TPR) repeat protein
LADFNQALQINPDHIATYSNRGSARHALGDLEGALADFDRAIQLTPRRAAALLYHNRAGVRITQQNFPAAMADYHEALEIDPQLCVAYISRGNARYHLGDQAGHVDYAMAFTIDPKLAAREVIRILAEDMKGEPVAVLTNCNNHLKANPKLVTAYIRRGLTLLLLASGRPHELQQPSQSQSETRHRLHPARLDPALAGPRRRGRARLRPPLPTGPRREVPDRTPDRGGETAASR